MNCPRLFGMTLSVSKNTEVFMEVQEAQRFLLCMELMIRRAQEDTESGLCYQLFQGKVGEKSWRMWIMYELHRVTILNLFVTCSRLYKRKPREEM